MRIDPRAKALRASPQNHLKPSSNLYMDCFCRLRLAKLNEEMKETEGLFGNPGDDTFTDVFRDFTNMASDNPEMLYRSKSIPEES